MAKKVKTKLAKHLLASMSRSRELASGDVPAGERGGGLIENVQVQNFMLVIGSAPGNSVSADCTLIKDTICNFMQFYDKPTLNIRFPEILR